MSANSEGSAGPQPFTVLDWIGTLVTGAAIAGLMLFPVGSYRKIFQDFGSPQDLPLLTRIVLSPGFPLVLALPALVSIGLGFRERRRVSRRRTWVVAAFGLACLGFAVCVVAMYLPIFTLAGKIKAD